MSRFALHVRARVIRDRVRDIQEIEVRRCGRVYTQSEVQDVLDKLAEQMVALCDAIAESELKKSVG